MRRCLISRLLLKDRLQSITYSINDLNVNVGDPKAYDYYDDLEFIILFVGILSLYVINLDVVSLFANLPFYVYSDVDHITVSDAFYQFE